MTRSLHRLLEGQKIASRMNGGLRRAPQWDELMVGGEPFPPSSIASPVGLIRPEISMRMVQHIDSRAGGGTVGAHPIPHTQRKKDLLKS